MKRKINWFVKFAHPNQHLYIKRETKYTQVVMELDWTYSLVFQLSIHLLDRVGLMWLIVRHTGEPAVQVIIIITVIAVGRFSSLQTL